MGYYTSFSLDIIPKPEIDSKIMREVISSYEFTIQDILEYNIDPIKWHEHDKEMVEVSKKYPEFIFILDGEGDEHSDIWRSFYKDGKSYTWSLDYVLPSFDETKLKY